MPKGGSDTTRPYLEENKRAYDLLEASSFAKGSQEPEPRTQVANKRNGIGLKIPYLVFTELTGPGKLLVAEKTLTVLQFSNLSAHRTGGKLLPDANADRFDWSPDVCGKCASLLTILLGGAATLW